MDSFALATVPQLDATIRAFAVINRIDALISEMPEADTTAPESLGLVAVNIAALVQRLRAVGVDYDGLADSYQSEEHTVMEP